MRIVHFSDIHLGCWTRDPSAWVDKRILGQANYFLRRRHGFHREYLGRAVQRIRLHNPDLVVCTGDLTCVGSPEEFEQALGQLSPLAANGASCPLIYVPGNHDAYVSKASCRESLATTFRRLNGDRWLLDELPREVRMRDVRVLVVNEAGPTNCLLSCGHLPPAVASSLASALACPREPGERRILVGHFPLSGPQGKPLPYRRRLHGADPLLAALREGRVDVSLCGHEHTPFVRYEANGAMEVCAGSLTATGRLVILDYLPAEGRFSLSWDDLSGGGPVAAPVGPLLRAEVGR